LVTERLTASGRHHHNSVFAFQDRADDFALAFTEIVEAEVLAQSCDRVAERGHQKKKLTRIS
jgi:hypothetical protein